MWHDSIVRRHEDGDFLVHDWGSDSSPGWGFWNTLFSASLDRTVNFDCGRWRFHINSDDGAILAIDGGGLPGGTSNWMPRGSDQYGDITLPSGPHHLNVRYYQTSGRASLRLDWTLLSACPPTSPTLTGPNDSAVLDQGTPVQPAWS